MNFAAETSTGIYRAGSSEFDIAILGVKQFGLTASGAVIPSGLAGGTF